MKNLRISLFIMFLVVVCMTALKTFIEWVMSTGNDWVLGVLLFIIIFGFIYYAVCDVRKGKKEKNNE